MKTTKSKIRYGGMLAILVLVLGLVGNLSGQDSPVRFRATVTAGEDHNVVPVCYGDYFVEVAINELLEDANAVLTGITSVQVCYRNPLGLVLGDNVEVYGYYWGGTCPKQYCGRVQIMDDSYYIMRTEGYGYGDNDWMVSGDNMYAIPPGNVGIGTTSPVAPLDVRRSAPGTNVVAGMFTNPSDAADSAVSFDLALGTALPTVWRIKASDYSMEFTNAAVLYPAITISSTNHVGMSNGLSVFGSDEPAIFSAVGMVPLILITGKHGLVSFGEDYGIYAWGGQKAAYFQGNVQVAGKLGVGTSNPQNELHIVGLAKFELPTGSIAVSTPGGWPGVIAFSSNGHRRDIIVDDSSLRFLTSPSSSAAPADNGITIREDGNVGIGTNFPGSYKLAVNGSAAKPGGGSWSNFSDIRLKEINGDYKAGLSEVSKLNPVRYRYKENSQLGLPADKEFVGVIAQNVQSAIPEAVEQDDKGYLMVNNDPIIWAMVNAIKQLKSENQLLKERLEALERMVQQHRFAIAEQVQ